MKCSSLAVLLNLRYQRISVRKVLSLLSCLVLSLLFVLQGEVLLFFLGPNSIVFLTRSQGEHQVTQVQLNISLLHPFPVTLLVTIVLRTTIVHLTVDPLAVDLLVVDLQMVDLRMDLMIVDPLGDSL